MSWADREEGALGDVGGEVNLLEGSEPRGRQEASPHDSSDSNDFVKVKQVPKASATPRRHLLTKPAALQSDLMTDFEPGSQAEQSLDDFLAQVHQRFALLFVPAGSQ